MPTKITRKAPVLIGLAVLVVLAMIGGWQLWSHRAQGEPEAVEFSDAELSPTLTEATVLALGEATHGTAEFQQARWALAAKLPQFRAIVLEEDFGSTAMVDRYVDGGPGTARDAAQQFGFALNQTEEMADLLQRLRDRNADLPTRQRIQLIGMDVQRVEANKELAIGWLQRQDPDKATEFAEALADWTDATDAPPTAAGSVLDELADAVDDAPAGKEQDQARQAVRTLQQNLQLADSGRNYAQVRAAIMADNLAGIVADQADRGNDHTLLFGHNGHLDKESAAYSHQDLGELAAQRWGDGYRVIGTDLHRATVSTGAKGERWQITMTNPTPLRGIFSEAEQGFLEFDQAVPVNRELLHTPVRMASAGESFRQWQAWVPQLNSVRMTPADSYDALLFVNRGTPTTPIS